jgi:hypothetical protein
METIQDAKAALEAAGLIVSHSTVRTHHYLLIGSSTRDTGEGIQIFENATALNQRNGEWVVLLRAEGLTQYEVPGTLAEGVSLILAAYQEHRKSGGMFKDACRRVLKDADKYLIGRSLAGV